MENSLHDGDTQTQSRKGSAGVVPPVVVANPASCNFNCQLQTQRSCAISPHAPL